MKKLRKTVSLAMCAVMLLTSGVVSASAAEVSELNEQPVSLSAIDTDSGIEPQGYVIVWKYRYYNGHYQKRRWNETLGIWVDFAWIDCCDEFSPA